ncbi:MAG: hypothetical protein NT001_00515 [Candidatus Woesearchaeota archaeon]|nr:hypothetical protein [Candidatus Woesearchaeota archaeon]
MDVEKMQKINRLSKELVDKGIYADLQEATKQAEIMLNKDDSGISSVMKRDNPNSNVIMPNTKREEKQMDMSQEEDVKMQLRKLAMQANDQAKTISDLKLNIMNIIGEINRMKIEPRKPAIMEKSHGNDQTMLNKEATEAKPHARTGNYNPTDVTIEKFFYSGPPR